MMRKRKDALLTRQHLHCKCRNYLMPTTSLNLVFGWNIRSLSKEGLDFMAEAYETRTFLTCSVNLEKEHQLCFHVLVCCSQASIRKSTPPGLSRRRLVAGVSVLHPRLLNKGRASGCHRGNEKHWDHLECPWLRCLPHTSTDFRKKDKKMKRKTANLFWQRRSI